jgi:hypothetical protein
MFPTLYVYRIPAQLHDFRCHAPPQNHEDTMITKKKCRSGASLNRANEPLIVGTLPSCGTLANRANR